MPLRFPLFTSQCHEKITKRALPSGSVMAWTYDPKRWCDRAQEMRSTAERLKDPEAKARMLRVAADYEKIVQTAIERLLRHAHSINRRPNPPS